MSLINGLFELFMGLIIVIGIVPAIVITMYMGTIIGPIIGCIALIIYLNKINRSYLIRHGILVHIYAFCTYVAMMLNPGTDGTFHNLPKVINSTFFASIFAILTIMSLILFIRRIKQ